MEPTSSTEMIVEIYSHIACAFSGIVAFLSNQFVIMWLLGLTAITMTLIDVARVEAQNHLGQDGAGGVCGPGRVQPDYPVWRLMTMQALCPDHLGWAY